ncbi:MAG: LysM peptidoglycan-binding domain-containing protein [Anaerolineae bacterium]|nr:LysM peptidoglycan-binding domain-containing protein [Anaerolineae bacterium]
MIQFFARYLHTFLLMAIAGLLGAILMRMTMAPGPVVPNGAHVEAISQQQPEATSEITDATATETIPPYTPLATLTPSRTLKPPPTFEPPTATLPPSATPTITPTQAIDLSVSIPGLRGAETPTPSTTPGCEPRKDWKLTYEVQNNDALIKIADRYNTSVSELTQANCLSDPNVIRAGQTLRVPGAVQPSQPKYECLPWEILTPIDGTQAIEGTGQLTFNWRGPRTPYNLIRIIEPDNSKFEVVVELRQNEQIDLADIPLDGWHTVYIYPLDENFVQINCLEGGPWRFRKNPKPTDTPTPDTPFGG